jgi:glutathione S-transferase
VQGATEREPAQKEAYDAMESRLRRGLEPGPYLLGDAFSTADILLASVFQWGPQLMPHGAPFDGYLKRLSARPALHRAQQKDDAPKG